MPSPVVFITGCSSGIGKALCWAFHAQGYQVVATARHLEKLADLQPAGITTLALDVTDAAVIQQAIDTAIDQHHHIDILINNAGYGQFGPLMDISQQKLQAQFQTNVFATLAMAQQVAPIMKQQKAGRIINIGSVVGSMGNPGQVNYAASKAGMLGLTKSIAYEVASRGITANAVAPGMIGTAMTDKLTDDQKEKINAQIPLARMGTPEEIAAAVLYLASEEGGYVTGTTLHVNGGMAML